MKRFLALVFILIQISLCAQPGRIQMPFMGRTTPISDPFDPVNSASNAIGYLKDDYNKVIKVDSTVAERVLTFSGHFDESLIDSFWHEFRNMPQTSGHQIIRFEGIQKNYLILFRRMYGDSFTLEMRSRAIITDTFSHRQTAEILYKAKSSMDRGFLDLSFDIIPGPQIVLRNIIFIPFDNSPNTFLENLCQNDLALIQSQQSNMLLDTVFRYATNKTLKEDKKNKRKLSKTKLTTSHLLTSRLMVKWNDLWVIGIYETDKSDEHLLLGYKLVDKKFKPALVQLIEIPPTPASPRPN